MARRALLATVLVALGVLAAPVAWAADVGTTSTPASPDVHRLVALLGARRSPRRRPLAPAPGGRHRHRERRAAGANDGQRPPAGALDGDVRRGDPAVGGAAARPASRRRTSAVVTVDDTNGKVVKVDLQEDLHPKARLTEKEARGYMERDDKSQDWVQRYRDDHQRTSSTLKYDNDIWTLSWFANGKEIARVRLWDKTHKILSSWTGPQVAWSMARGRKWSFGKRINDPRIFIPLMALFVVGLFDWRRPLSVRNLDVLMLASFGLSLYFFNAGEIFWSVPLAYPPLLWLFGRLLWLGFGKGARPGYGTRWPIWLVAGLAVFALGFRAGLNVWGSNVIDVGYAERRRRRSPAGVAQPVREHAAEHRQAVRHEVLRRHLRRLRADGRRLRVRRGPRRHVRARHLLLVHADDGGARLERPLGRPAGRARHVDPVRLPGRGGADVHRLEARRQTPGRRGAVPVGDVPVHGLLDELEHERRDTRGVPGLGARPVHDAPPARVHARARHRGQVLARPARAARIRADRTPRQEPLEWEYTEAGPPLVPRPGLLGRAWDRLRPGPTGLKVGLGFLLALVLSFVPLMLIDGPIDGLVNFWDRTFGWQLDRPSPFSIWDWGEYPGFPDLAAEQKVLKLGLVLLAAALYVLPKRLDLYRVAAFSGALIVGFQICLTHWHYLYIPWFMPFVALALLAPRTSTADEAVSLVEEPVAEPAAERRRRLAWGGRSLRPSRPQALPTPPRAPAG